MQEPQIFNFEDQQVRTVLINNDPYFVGKDAADVLGYTNSRDALNKHVDDEDKGVAKCDTLGGMQTLTVINESGLYSLIFGSKLRSAKRFKHWVTSEVLPKIRKTGGYTNVPASFSEALRLAADMEEEKAQLKLENEEMKPKALFADSVSTSHTTILIGDLAKVLRGNGIEIGQNRLFEVLRSKGYLISRKSASYNMPTQKAMDLGLFKVKETTITHADGHVTVNKTPKVTGRGQIYFVNKFLNRELEGVEA